MKELYKKVYLNIKFDNMKRLNLLFAIFFAFNFVNAQISKTAYITPTTQTRQATYCNPINLDYGFCPIPNFVQNGKHRATADPVIAVYDNKYFLFSTNQWG